MKVLKLQLLEITAATNGVYGARTNTERKYKKKATSNETVMKPHQAYPLARPNLLFSRVPHNNKKGVMMRQDYPTLLVTEYRVMVTLSGFSLTLSRHEASCLKLQE